MWTTKIGAALCLVAISVQAQTRDQPQPVGNLYRQGEPEVMARPPAPRPAGTVEAEKFRSAYTRAGNPRIMIFWNREFGEDVSSTYNETFHAESQSDERTTSELYVNGAAVTKSARASLDANVGSQRVPTARYNAMDTNTNNAVESAFIEALTANGARLIDRNLAIRTAPGARNAGTSANMQALETDAALGRADILVEVLQNAAPGTPTGAMFKIVVKDLRAARVLASFTSAGNAPSGPRPLVAGPGGFVRAAPLGTSPYGVGVELANQSMMAIAQSLRR